MIWLSAHAALLLATFCDPMCRWI
uniref:Uncharacterized protein n=1 Tax=Rhizophora mucronata TaxID=61149 RepID=A0A2P2PFP3_RHIMU